MDWARDVFVKNAKLYELVLEGMWERGEEDAVAISSFLNERGMANCRVLDVPCGIGRVGVPLARLGFHVTGVDLSPHLISSATAKAERFKVKERVMFLRGDMHELDSIFERGSFDAVINVFTSIGYGTEEDDLIFFRAARETVRRGGLLLISGLRNREYIMRNPSQNVYEENRHLLILDRYKFDTSRSREEGTWRFYARQQREERGALKFRGEFPISIRVYSPHELVSRLAATGWNVLETYETFVSRGAFRPDSPVYSLAAEAV